VQGEGALDGKTPLELALAAKNGNILQHMIQCNRNRIPGFVLQACILKSPLHKPLCSTFARALTFSECVLQASSLAPAVHRNCFFYFYFYFLSCRPSLSPLPCT